MTTASVTAESTNEMEMRSTKVWIILVKKAA